MRTAYSVWQWNPFNKWTLELGSNSWSKANQVARALKQADPQNWYGVYGAWDVPAAYELVGIWNNALYSWGYVANTPEVGHIVFYALAKLLDPHVKLGARNPTTGGYKLVPGSYGYALEIALKMPSWRAKELDVRYKVANVPGYQPYVAV